MPFTPHRSTRHDGTACFLGMLLSLGPSHAIAAAETSASLDRRPPSPHGRHLSSSAEGSISVPLVPHHAHRARRQRRETEGGGRFDPPRRRTAAARRRATEEPGSAPLYQGYGTHYMDLWIGSPVPQRQTVIVDTGSSLTAFPCSTCDKCGESYHTDSYFREYESETFERVACPGPCEIGSCSRRPKGGKKDGSCRIKQSYSEGSSWYAYEAKDLAYAGGPHDRAPSATTRGEGEGEGGEEESDAMHAYASQFAFRLTFGCQDSLTGLFRTQLADGIVGMSKRDASYWAQLHRAGVFASRKFSLCFSRSPTVDRNGTAAGAVVFGGANDRLHSSTMVYAANVPNARGKGSFPVRVKKVYLREGGSDSALYDPALAVRRIDVDEKVLNTGSVILDSGTTDTYMIAALATPFYRAYKDMAGEDFPQRAVKLTPEQLRAMPTILFQFAAHEGGVGDESTIEDPNEVAGLTGNVDPSLPRDILFAMPASHYMEYDEEKDIYKSRITFRERRGSTLGANAMMGHDVLFDVDNDRIGFAESDCDYASLLPLPEPGHAEESRQSEAGKEGGGAAEEDRNGGGAGSSLMFRGALGLFFVGGFLFAGILVIQRYRQRNDDAQEFEPLSASEHSDGEVVQFVNEVPGSIELS